MNYRKKISFLLIFIVMALSSFSSQESPKIRRVRFQPPMEELKLSSGYGYRKNPVLKRVRKHQGLDFSTPRGTQVMASMDGTVVEARYEKTYGNYIILSHVNGYESRYAHLNNLKVKRGDEVKAGQVIGLSGNTGRSTGPHLHFEIRKDGVVQNPKNYIKIV